MPAHATKEAAERMVVLFDDEGDDKICGTQIGTVARALGLKPTEGQVEEVCGKKYKKGEARITGEQFWEIYEKLKVLKEVGNMNEYVEALRVYDKDENGCVILGELKHALLSVGERMTREQAEEILEGAADKKKLVKYQDFIKKILAGPFPPKDD